MREIIFRAKRKDNGEWVEGNLIHRTAYYGDPVDDYFILTDGEFDEKYYFDHEVIPETVSQYTGLTDRNGCKIWENDIVRTNFFGKDNGLGQNFSGYDVFVVRWFLDSFRIENKRRLLCFYGEDSSMEVIGNIFDNSDLLEESED